MSGKDTGQRVAGYLGRVLDGDGDPVGTCFQVAPGVLVTAWHVLEEIGAEPGAGVRVDPLDGGEAFVARVRRGDPVNDLAVLVSESPLAGVAGVLARTDRVALRSAVSVTGHAVVEDGGHWYRFLVAPGEWAGGTTRDDAVPLGCMTAGRIMPGMSGAPVVRDDDGVVAGVVSGRYNSADGWLAGNVWVARTEALAPLLAGIAEVTVAADAGAAGQDDDGTTRHSLLATITRRYIGRRAAIAVLAVVAVLAVGAPVVVQRLLADPGSTSGKSAPDTTPVAASSSSPPILVESVAELKSISDDGSLALPQPLRMTSAELAAFNNNVVANSSAYSAWYARHDGAAVDFGITTVTLRGNARESVRIADMKVLKNCRSPFDGTYFQGYTQGSGDTIKIGFDLDSPDPIPQQMALTGRGLTPLGVNFFDQTYVALAPGENITLAIGAFTKHYACSFRLQMIVATSYGTFSENIDNHGQPFIVTARAAPTAAHLPYSGYKSAYAYLAPNGEPIGWGQINPDTYKK